MLIVREIIKLCFESVILNYRDKLIYQEGSVLDLELPILNTDTKRHSSCLVVSSTSIDAIRERIFIPGPLGHLTVVPLRLAGNYSYDENSDAGVGLAEVDVYPSGGGRTSVKALALCQEVYSVDWRTKKAEKIGSVHDHDMLCARLALRDYLKLPLKE